MFFSRSVLASAAILSFSATIEGSVLHRKAEEHVEVKRVAADEAEGAWTWRSVFGKRQDTILDCPNDQFAALLDNAPNNDVQGFCNDWLNLAPATVTSEVTPTVTVTTSASETTTQTITQRTVVTTTVLETATITASASVRRRMVAAAAQIESIASSIVDSVIASGTPTSTTAAATKGSARLAAEQGLVTACSCKQVQPTSTVTDAFTVPAVTTTVGVRILNIIRQTETRTFTSTATIRASAVATASVDANSATPSTDAVSSRTDVETSALAESSASSSISEDSSSSSSSSADEPSSAPAVTTIPIASTSVEAGNSTATASGGAAVVTAIPFSCDEDDINKDIDQVVGGLRLGYSVYCNTELVSQDRVGRPIPVNDATSCAAQCSLLNSQGAQDACQSAVFTPSNSTDASTGGTCELFTASENGGLQTSPAPGSVAIVHTGSYANGDECAALNATTSAIVPTITNGPIVIETPGLVTQSSGGGVSRTYVSANTTDAQGFVHYSWYEIYASSANWWAVYETSWACSATLTRTIEQPATTVIEGTTITAVTVTTIIGNGYTTIISGDTTTTIRGGGGVGGATFVPASTTGGDAGLTTFFSTAVQASTGTDGIVTPTPAPEPSIGGVGNVTVIEDFSTFFSTGSAGIISPSASASLNASVSGSVSEEVIVSSTATTLTISGALSTFLSTGSDGVITPTATPILETIVSSGAVTFTISGSGATVTSTGGAGVVSPSSSAGSSAMSSSTTDEEEWDSENSYGPKTSAIVVVSSTILTITSTGASGVETPTVVTAVSSETLIVEISNTTISGNGSVSTATSIATFNSTGGNGIVTPTVVTEIITTAGGVSNFTSIIATATANSTGGGGVIPPASTLVVTETLNSTLSAPIPTGGFSTGGVGNFSTGSETAFTTSTGGSGIIPPAPSNSTSTGPPFTNSEVDRSGSFSRSTATATSNSTGSSGFATPSSNLTTAVETPSINTTLVLTVPLSTGFTSTIEIPIINSTIVSGSAPTPTPTAPANVTSSVPTNDEDRSGSISRSSSVAINSTFTLTLPVSTGTTTSEVPEVPSDETTPPPTASQTASTLVVTATTNITLSLPSGNVTLIPPTTRPFDNTTAPLPTPTGNITSESLVSINYSTVPSFPTGNLSTILPPSSTGNITIVIPSPTTNVTIIIETPFVPSNSTTAPPPSITVPPASLNSTLSLPAQNSTGPVFSNTEVDRTGRFSRSSGIILTTGTGGFGNITATTPAFPTGNSTLPSGPTAPTTEACPSPTEFSTITREVIITTYTIETVPVIASTCITSDAAAAAPTGLNGTFPTGGNATEPADATVLPSVVESLASAISSLTATDAVPTASEAAPVVSAILSAISSVVSDVIASTSSETPSEATAAPVSRFRRSGTLATQEQINAACSDPGNLVLSPTFNIQPNNSTEGWFVSQFNPTIPVESVTQANGTIARFRSAFPGQTAALSQPLTLCPGTQYELTALTRQANVRSGCSVQLRIGSNSVFTAAPQTSWVSRTERFTAGSGAEGASQDLTLVMSCAGFAGAAVGADPEGYMVGEVGAVSVSAEQFRQ